MKNAGEMGERLIRLGLGALFIWAGLLKAITPLEFADSIAGYQMLPAFLINSVALALPIFEVALGFGLVVGWRQRLLAQMATGLLLVFIAALFQAQWRQLNIDCACFGSASQAVGAIPPLPRDLVLLVAAVFLWRRARTREVRAESSLTALESASE